MKSKTPNNNLQNQRSKIDIDCWNCGRKGHYQNECRASKKDSGDRITANVVPEESNDGLICSLESKTKAWVLDSGASFHVTSSRELLDNSISSNLGDDQVWDMVDKGSMQIKLNRPV